MDLLLILQQTTRRVSLMLLAKHHRVRELNDTDMTLALPFD